MSSFDADAILLSVRQRLLNEHEQDNCANQRQAAAAQTGAVQRRGCENQTKIISINNTSYTMNGKAIVLGRDIKRTHNKVRGLSK